MAQWEPQYGIGLYGWGDPRAFYTAAPLGDIARNITQQRMYQQNQFLQGMQSLGQAIRQGQQDDIANAIQYSHQYGVPMQYVTPDQVPDYGGVSGLAMNIRQMQAENQRAQAQALYNTYPVPLGGQVGTIPMTAQDIARMYDASSRNRMMGAMMGAGSGGLPSGFSIDPNTGMIQDALGNNYFQNSRGGLVRIPSGQGALPGISQYLGNITDPTTGKSRKMTLDDVDVNGAVDLGNNQVGIPVRNPSYDPSASPGQQKIVNGISVDISQPYNQLPNPNYLGVGTPATANALTGGTIPAGVDIDSPTLTHYLPPIPKAVYQKYLGQLPQAGASAPPAANIGPTTTTAPGQGAPPGMSDEEMLEWAKNNPNDPRAAAINRLIGP